MRPSNALLWNGLLILLFANCTFAQNWVLNTLIPKNYDKLQVPLQGNETLNVNASMTINSFTVTEKTQTLTVDVDFCLNWTDYRLQNLTFPAGSIAGQNTTETLHLSEVKLTKLDSLWKPLVYFRNAIVTSTVSPLAPIEYMQVWPNEHLIKHCTRLSVNFICHLELANFPFDEHYCHFELESIEKSAQQLNIRVKSVTGVTGNSKFRIRNTYTGTCEPTWYHPFGGRQRSENDTASPSARNCAYGGVQLVRCISFYVIRYYCPTFLMVAMGMVSFWLPTNAWPARIILTASVLFTLITTSLQGYNEVPSNDVTSLVWWLWVCQLFIYVSMIEYAIALSWQYHITDKKVAISKGKEPPKGHYFGNKGWFKATGVGVAKFIGFFFGQIDHHRDPINRNKVDYVARLLFPFMLMLFVLVYIVATIPVWANKYRW